MQKFGKKFASLEEADRAEDDYYKGLSPNERVDLLLVLVQQYGMVFDEQRDGDSLHEQEGVGVLVDAFSAKFLRGTQVDFSDAVLIRIPAQARRKACICRACATAQPAGAGA